MGVVWVYRKKIIFSGKLWAKKEPLHPTQELTQQHDQHINIVILVSHHDDNKTIGVCPQTNYFGPKKSYFGPKKGHFGQPGPLNGPSSGQTVTYRKTEGIQSYPRIWGTYDPIESDPSDPKKGGLYGCSVKKCRFSLLDIFRP